MTGEVVVFCFLAAVSLMFWGCVIKIKSNLLRIIVWTYEFLAPVLFYLLILATEHFPGELYTGIGLTFATLIMMCIAIYKMCKKEFVTKDDLFFSVNHLHIWYALWPVQALVMGAIVGFDEAGYVVFLTIFTFPLAALSMLVTAVYISTKVVAKDRNNL